MTILNPNDYSNSGLYRGTGGTTDWDLLRYSVNRDSRDVSASFSERDKSREYRKHVTCEIAREIDGLWLMSRTGMVGDRDTIGLLPRVHPGGDATSLIEFPGVATDFALTSENLIPAPPKTARFAQVQTWEAWTAWATDPFEAGTYDLAVGLGESDIEADDFTDWQLGRFSTSMEYVDASGKGGDGSTMRERRAHYIFERWSQLWNLRRFGDDVVGKVFDYGNPAQTGFLRFWPGDGKPYVDIPTQDKFVTTYICTNVTLQKADKSQFFDLSQVWEGWKDWEADPNV